MYLYLLLLNIDRTTSPLTLFYFYMKRLSPVVGTLNRCQKYHVWWHKYKQILFTYFYYYYYLRIYARMIMWPKRMNKRLRRKIDIILTYDSPSHMDDKTLEDSCLLCTRANAKRDSLCARYINEDIKYTWNYNVYSIYGEFFSCRENKLKLQRNTCSKYVKYFTKSL